MTWDLRYADRRKELNAKTQRRRDANGRTASPVSVSSVLSLSAFAPLRLGVDAHSIIRVGVGMTTVVLAA
jgi:hypothetical protein